MNKYETWLSRQPQLSPITSSAYESFAQTLRRAMDQSIEDTSRWILHLPDTEPTPQDTVSRSEHRTREETRQGYDRFRAFLGYGQGRSRQMRTAN